MLPSLELPEWFPEWALPSEPPGTSRREDPTLPTSQTTADDSQSGTNCAASGEGEPEHVQPEYRDGFIRVPPREIIVVPSQDRTVRRKLRGIHLFMITINGTLGTGLYWRGGQILELGGPLAVLLSFLLVGLLSWAVMQCITEMLCIWPIPGALSVYVSEFVDVELGIAVGIAYWFTYSVSFSALIATSAAEFGFWPGVNGNTGIYGGIIYLCIPLSLVFFNALGIEMYAFIEVVSGTIKLLFLAVIVIALIAINLGVGPSHRGYIGVQYWNAPTAFDTDAATNWGTAFLMCLSIATFAYVGVEIVAASALEARWPRRTVEDETRRTTSDMSRQSNDTLIGNSVKFSSIFISVLATIAYSVSGMLASFDIPRDDCQLPRLSWINSTESAECSTSPDSSQTNTASAFVAIAAQSGIPHLADIFNFFLVFTSLSCANTNLYVASRALFGLTSRLDGGSGQSWFLRLFSWFGKTNRRGVPMKAMVLSAVAFWWVPFLQLRGGTTTSTPIGMFIEILAEMGSVGVLIVWSCECLAFIRYYHCITSHRAALEEKKVPQVRRWDRHDYPYRSHGQPVLAYIALTGCIFVLIVVNAASLWNGFHKLPFLSSYLIVLSFIALWILLKLVRGAKWSFVDLSNSQRVVKKLLDLHDIRMGAT
ncbi:putative proline-specific permease [Talaromyces proteolyticus]|uniref:Proline-specific permease n=1 Tax=Talaromyces proteolyticus TaxID=1131652 RepID=A0AAD4KS52_9EURO|nr:putative proline-specific permease [Talaromyces proteolyticus]KAH8697603.1 putative proline-specific permease [Talaromyces proteolyticus]